MPPFQYTHTSIRPYIPCTLSHKTADSNMMLHNPFTMNIAHTLASIILCIAVNELNQHGQKSMFIMVSFPFGQTCWGCLNNLNF